MNQPVKPPARNVDVQTPGEVLQVHEVAAKAEEAPKDAKPKNRLRSDRDYRNMRAVDIDASTLTSPVLTLDGYLCPPVPEKK